MITYKASELEFISRIRQDGTGCYPPDSKHLDMLIKADEPFILQPLSMSQKTFIAFNMSVYTVKIKEHGIQNT